MLEQRFSPSYLNLVDPLQGEHLRRPLFPHRASTYGGYFPVGAIRPSVLRWPYGLFYPPYVPGTRPFFLFRGPT